MSNSRISSYIRRPDEYRMPNIIDYVEAERERIRNAAPEDYREYIDRGAAIQRTINEREREEKRREQRRLDEIRRKAEEERVERERREAKRKAEEEEYEEQKRREKKILEYQQEEQKKEAEKEYESWLKEKTDWLGPLASPVQWAFSGKNIVRSLYDISNELGNFTDKQLSTYIDSKGGGISLNDIKIQGAEAHKKVVAIENQIAQLEAEQKQFANESGLLDQNWVVANKDTEEYQQRLNKYNAYLSLIQNLYLQLNDPYDEKLPGIALKDIDEMYKADFVSLNQNQLKTLGGALYDWMRGIGVTEYASNFRNQIAKDRTKQLASLYDDELERTKYTGYGGVKTNNSVYGDTEYDVAKTNDNIRQWKAENEEAARDVESAKKVQETLGDFFNVAESYKKGEQIYQNASLFNSGYWHYVFPGTMGSSFSSVNQAVATGMLVAGVGATIATGNPMFMNTATLASGYNRLEAGKDENKAESFEKRIERLYGSLQQMDSKKRDKIISQLLNAATKRDAQNGHDIEWIRKQYDINTEEGVKNLLKQNIILSGIDSRFNITDPEYKKALIHSTAGIQALYEADNMRTISMLPFELAFEVYGGPLDKMVNKTIGFVTKPFEKGASRIVKEAAERTGERTARTAAEDAATSAGKYSNGFRRKSKTSVEAFRSGFDSGSAVGASLGFGSVGSVVTGAAAGTANTAIHLAKEALPNKARTIIDGFEEVVANKYMKVYDKLLKDREWLPLAAKYGYQASKQILGRSMEEGAEEAVQYINSKQDFASKYGFGGINFGDLIINDLVQGKEVLKAYGSLFGLTDSKYKDDAEFWQNVKGGFALGGGMTAVTNITGSVKDYARLLDGDKFAVQNFAMMREADKINRAASVQFAKAAMNGNVEGVRNAINTRMQHDRMRENPEYTLDEYDAQLRQLNYVARRTNDPITRAKLEAKGIKYGSEEYANAIADLASLDEQRSDNRKAIQKNNIELQQRYYSKEFNDEASEIAEEIMEGSDSYIQEQVTKAGESAASEYLRSEREAGRDTSTDEFKKSVAKIRSDAENSKREELQSTAVETVRDITRAVNKLHALIKLKSKIKSINDWYKLASEKFGLNVMRPDAKLITKSIEKQIQEQKAYLKKAYDKFNDKASDVETIRLINSIRQVVRIDQENAELFELENALITANNEVVQNYINQFEEGIVANKEGKYEYNPAQRKIVDDRAQRYMKAVLSGNKEEADKIQKEEESAPYDESKVPNNPYAKRVKDIMETNERDAALDWMVQDIAEGDAVAKAYEVYQEEKEKEAAEAKKTEAKPSEDPFDSEVAVTSKPDKKKTVKSKLDANKKKYQERIQKIKDSYSRRKARYKKWQRGNLNAGIPFMNLFVNVANKLFNYALPLGYYSIAKFVEDIQVIMSDVNISDIISDVKRAYVDKFILLELNQSDLANNMDVPEVVAAFTIKDDVNERKGYNDPQPVVAPIIQKLKDALNKMRLNAIPQISGYFDTIVKNGNSVDVYTNKAAIDILSEEDKNRLASILNTIQNMSHSDIVAYMQLYISKEAVDEYEKYLATGNTDIIAAIARAIFENTYEPDRKAGIKIGKVIRDNVINILLGNYDNLIPIEAGEGEWDNFIKSVENVKKCIRWGGYTVLDTMQPIYAVDKDGNKISSEADIIIVNEQGDVKVIDVTYGYASVEARLAQPRTTKVTLDLIYKNEDSILTNTENILNTIGGINIKGSYVYCFVYDSDYGALYEDTFILLHEPVLSTEDIQNNLQRAKVIIDSLNQQIKDYNAIAEKLKLPLKDLIEPVSYQTQKEFDEYFDYLSTVQEGLKSDLLRLNELEQGTHEEQEIEIEELAPEDTPDEFIINFSAAQLYDDLTQKVRALDDARNAFPIGRIVTPEDKLNIIQIYKALFDAQIALNEFLHHPDAQLQDVTNECEVIASTLEQIHINRESLGRDAIFVQKWWLTKILNLDGSHDVSAYANQLLAWVNTLSGYVDTNDNFFDQHPALVRWYSSVINTYLPKLIDQVEKIKQPSNQLVFDRVIDRAKGLISQFNLNWGVEPDKVYDTPALNELEYIQRMPLRWGDLYGASESHSPAIDLMAKNSNNYYYFSQNPDFLLKLEYSFGLYKGKNGKDEVKVKITYGDEFAYFGFENDDEAYRKNNTLTLEIAKRNKILNRGNKKFTNKLRAMIEYRMKHPEYKIVVDVSTNKGSINYSKDVNKENNVFDVIFSDPYNNIDPYNVTVSEKDHIGVLAVMLDSNNNPIDYKIKTGPNLKSDAAEKFDKEFKKRKIKTPSGMLVYFFDYGDGRRIGIPMPGRIIGNDANRLVSLIQKLSNGTETEDGYNILSLLEQRLFIQSTKPNYSSSFNNRSNLIEIVSPNIIKIGGVQYNLDTLRNDVISIVSRMHNVIPGFLLSNRINNTIPAVVDKFRQDASLLSVTLPNGLVITRDDVVNNSTWLGHFFRNGIIITRAEPLVNPKYNKKSIKGYRQINFSNPRLVNKNAIDNQPSATQSEDKTKQQIDRIHGLINSLKMTISQDELVYRSEEEQRLFVDEIKEFFKYVFGTSEDLEFVLEDTLNDSLGIVGNDEVIAGECTSQLIRISTYAPKSVMYHEAFHKIIELVLPDSEREALYEAYRKNNGKNLSERAVAEALADMFVDYMLNKKAFKEAKWYNKVRLAFKKIGLLASLVNNLGVRQAKALFSVYKDTNRGKIRERIKEEEIERKKQRFEEKFGDHLYRVIRSRGEVKYEADFKYLSNSADLNEMCMSLGYLIGDKLGISDIYGTTDKITIDERSLDLIDDKTRRLLCNLDEHDNPLPIEEGSEHKVRAWREMFEKKQELRYDANGKPYYYTYYPKFAAIHTLVGDYLSSIMGDYKGKYQVAEEDDTEDEIIQRKNIDKYDKASIEFNKLDGTTAKVKQFFGTIPYPNPDDANNMFGTNTFMPLEEVYNIIVNDHHKVRTIDELRARLAHDASYNPMYAVVYQKFDKLYQQMYKTDENGNRVIDYDAESTMIQILMTIRSQKHDFKIAETTTTKAGVKSTQIKRSSSDRDTRVISRQWQQILVTGLVGVFQHGATKDGKLAFRDGIDKNIFNNLVNFFDAIIADLAENADSYPAESAVEVRKEIVRRLNQVGILISDKALEHMLVTKYHGLGADAIYKWLTTSTTETSISPFLKALKQFAPNGIINDRFIKNEGYAELSFVKNLANAEGLYRRITTLQMALGLNGKKLFSISQNSTISKICDDLSIGDRNSQFIKTLLGFGYNLYDDGLSKRGSIIARYIAEGKPIDLRLFTFIGSKSDNKGDTGSSYTEQATVDDYMAKLAMLQSGSIIMPTLADKSMYQAMDTYGVDGQKLDIVPGMKFVTTKPKIREFDQQTQKYVERVDKNAADILGVTGAPKIAFMGKYAYLRPNDDVLRQMIEYAVTEKVAIERCMEDLKTLKDEEKIKNYHTANKDKDTGKTVEPNGTRFLVFTEIVTMKNGKAVTINFNDPNESSERMLQRANDEFFSKPIEEQMTIMAQTLAMQTAYEVQKAEDLGLVSRTDISIHNLVTGKDGKPQQKEVVRDRATNRSSLLNITSDQLNKDQINAVTQQLLATMPDSWKALNKPETLALYNERRDAVRSMAIAAILQDATLRSIISSQEVLRCFCGHPGMFKVTYDFKNSIIKDSTFDLQKRIGGMISTGDDNVLDLPNMKRTYTCAEIKDYEVGLPENALKSLQDKFETGMLADLYYRHSYVDRSENVDLDIAMRVKNHELIPEQFETDEQKAKWFKFVDNTVDKAKQYADAYKDGINVADGAAYITADMCRDMLRMNGKLDAKAVRALLILTDENTLYSWMLSAQAYKDIYDAINITPTKYTAYGFREHTVNDSKCSDVAVPYYNKFALFPIFPCMATGSMYQLYEKMKNEGVDMALMDSAVKVGSLGAVKYNGKSIDVPFNTYTQEFSFIRKQLNTDPEEGSTTAVGSQVMKVGLQNLILNKVYQDFLTGENIIGQQIYDNIMNTVDKLAKIGVKEITDRFMENGVCNQKKLSEYLNEQLNAKNASNTTIEAIQTHKENGVDVLNMPLAATSDANWIESIIISLMKKEVIDINAPGSSFIQRSVFAIEQGGNPYLSINDGKKLKMINENGSMDCILSMDYFTDVLFANNMIGKTFEEQRQWLIDNKIIGNTKDVKANTIGYRVPTQAQSSIHSLRCVDVLPASKNTIILPEEFTKITGADFDIDHLYLWSYNYSIGKSGEATLSTESDKKRLQNDLLTNMLTLINSVENSMHFLYKTVDTDTGLLRNVSDKLQGATSYKHHAFNFGTLHELIDRKNDYITGKIGIGPYALNVTNLELTRLAKVKFAETIVTKSTRISKLDNMVDVDDNPIASWESGYINGHVDIVKDPFITSLNINQFTYNLSNLLTRCGFSETTLWFLCQPIIKKMAAASNGANGQYTRDGSRSTYSIKETAIAKACADVTGKDEAALVDLLDKIKNPSTKEDYRYIAKCINYIEENAGLLLKVAIETDKDPNIEEVTYAREGGVEAKYNVKDVQLQVLKAYTALDKYQKSLGKLVQYTKIDTKNYGKSLIQTRRYLKIYKNLVHPDERDKSIFDMDSIDRLINNTWIEYKTENAIMLPFLILGGQVFNANDTFVNEVLNFADILGTSEDITEDMVNELSKSVITAIKSAYIINYAKTFDDGLHIKPKTDADIAKMFTSQNALSKRLNRLLDLIRNNPNYKRLAGNYLLLSITAEFEEDPIIADGKLAQRPSFISISSNVGDNKRNSDMFSEAWEDLLNDDDPFVRNFANDLIIYSFLTSGEYNGWTHMFKYVPYSWRVGETKGFDHKVETFANFIKRMLAGGLSEIVNRDILDDVVANNFMNNSIIRSSRIVDLDGNLNFVTNRKGNIAIGKWVEDIAEAPTYITLRKPGTKGKNQDDYRLYKLAAFYENHPVYAEIIKRGYHHKGYDIYEYGWDFNYIENKSTNSMLYEDEINEAVKKLEQDENTPITDDLNKLISIVSSEVNKVVNERKDNDGGIVQTDEKSGTTQSEYVMQSGGAPGSDTIWGQIASEFGVTKQNHWYHGERNSKNSPGGNILISQEDYEEGKYKVAAAAKMNWGYQYDTMKDDRLIRNWAQVKYADAVFAVGHIVGKGQRVFPNLANDTRVASTTVVQGGTGYAVGMAIIEGKPVYVFDQERGKWASCINGLWKWLDETPTLTKQFAGIGTREINDAGKLAIRDVFEKTFNNNNDASDATLEVQNTHFYSGDVTPEPDVVFVFGSNTEGKHGDGAAALAKSEFGAIQGQAEGLQGNSYAIITKDLKKAKEASWSYLGRSEDWYRPGLKEENHIKWWYNPPKAVEKGTVPKGYTESTYDGYPALKFKKGVSPRHADHYYFVKDGKYFEAFERMDSEDNWGYVSEERNVGEIPEKVIYYFEGQSEKDHYWSVSTGLSKIYGSYGSKDFKGHSYSEVYNHPLNKRRSIQPELILNLIKKMYDVARQNPDKIFKVSNYKSGKISLNGYLGEEMMQLFIDAGPIPNNVQFNEEWSDVMYNHYEDNNKLNNNNDSELSEDEQREALGYKKACEGGNV